MRVEGNTRAAMRLLCPTLVALVIFTSAHAQRDKSYILSKTPVEGLKAFIEEQQAKDSLEYARALEIVRAEGLSKDGLVGLDEKGRPKYHDDLNLAASLLTNTFTLRQIEGVDGDGMVVGMWEAGTAFTPLITHQDFQATGAGSRISLQQSGLLDTHASHVAGTLIGQPPSSVSQSSTGMAPKATMVSYGSGSATTEIASEVLNNGLLVSNHSYGGRAGWQKESTNTNLTCAFLPYEVDNYTWYGGAAQFTSTGDDPNHGRYGSDAVTIDAAMRLAPMHLMVMAAGNSDNTVPDNNGICPGDRVRNGTGGSYVEYDDSIHPPNNKDQTSTIHGNKTAKNILVVGNLVDGTTLSSSSSRGGTDDGRIKPDICGKGTGIYSADSTANGTSYKTLNGTSMASPNVAGSMLLLQELYEKRNGGTGKFMTAASLKGLAIHTATDIGDTGPDFEFGWGLLDAFNAGLVINQDASHLFGQQSSRIIEDEIVSSSDFDQHFFHVDAGQEVTVTLCYTDYEGFATTINNNTSPRLRNDLDLLLVRYDANGNNVGTYSPYKYGYQGGSVTYGDNDVDNVEKRTFIAPATGRYMAQVALEGTLTSDSNTPTQPYSLIISGISDACYYDLTHTDMNLISRTYNASNDIESIGNVINGATVTYEAGNKVILKPGFNAFSGSSFNARIQGCTP